MSILCIVASPLLSEETERHQERILIYAFIGPVMPLGEMRTDYKIGLHAGLGAGIVVGAVRRVSLEIGTRYRYHYFPYKVSQKTRYGYTAGVEKSAFSIESRIRFDNLRVARPCLLIGAGSMWNKPFFHVGTGVDLCLDSELLRMLFLELKYVKGEFNFLQIDAGIRIG
jgi:hypothetical protein